MPRYLVDGDVQGVGFRYYVMRQAQALGLDGWVRNLPDGRVEVLARGNQGALSALETALRRGPSRARVSQVEKLESLDEVDAASGFHIR